MNPEWLKIGIDGAQFALTGVVAVYVYWANHARAGREELARLSTRLDERLDEANLRLTQLDASAHNTPSAEFCAAHRGRVDMIERLMTERPGHDDMKRVHQRIDEISALVGEVRGRLSGIERSLALITEHLLDQPARGGA